MVKVSGGVCTQKRTVEIDGEIKGHKTNSNLLSLSRGKDKGGLPLCNLDQESGLALQYMTKKTNSPAISGDLSLKEVMWPT